MLKTMSAEERARSYEKQNPRPCLPFSREASKRETPGKKQVGYHPEG